MITKKQNRIILKCIISLSKTVSNKKIFLKRKKQDLLKAEQKHARMTVRYNKTSHRM